MKQVVQVLKSGELLLLDVPVPALGAGRVMVRTTCSVVSAGTERQMMEFGQKSLLGKALERPDLVRKVMAVAQTEGVAEAYRQAMGRLDTFRPLGYSSAGVVVDVGPDVRGIRVGDRLACSGSGFACHAEYVTVPQTLCAPIPDSVSNEDAAFAALGAISLHALRLAELQLGDRVVIIGLGLIGLLGVQIAKAWGCQVLGADVATGRANLARQLGADQAVAGGRVQVLDAARSLFGGAGADAVVIFASTPSNEPLELAAELARVRGRIVVPGLVGLDVPRRSFYEKELGLKVSRAWGPGLYDPEYEERGHDYPLPFVRWTAGRNMEAFLQLLAQSRVQIQPLITHRFPIERATEAYQLIAEGKEPFIGVVLTYGERKGEDRKGETESGLIGALRSPTDTVIWLKQPTAPAPEREQNKPATSNPSTGSGQSLQPPTLRPAQGRLSNFELPISIGFIGAGNFAKATLMPAIRRIKGVQMRGIATATGASARHTGDKFGFDYCTTDYHELLDDPQIDTIIITTRHDTHAHLAAQALRAGKHVFVEKPLALDITQLNEVVAAYRDVVETTQREGETKRQGDKENLPISPSPPLLVVGFNRRFSPFTRALKEWLSFTNLPMVINCRVNAGFVPPERWEQTPEVGGGRIVGEVCHFIDLLQHLTDAHPVRVYAEAIKAAGQFRSDDNVVVTLQMSDGSAATITYTASGDKAFPREHVEVFRGGAVGVVENFKTTRFTHQGRTYSKRNLFGVDRGHQAEMQVFFAAIRNGGVPPVAFSDYVWTTLTTFSIVESMQRGRPIQIELPCEP